MPEAMAKIRNELGTDAVILSSRYIRPKGITNILKKKLLEVVVAHDNKVPDKQKKIKEEITTQFEPLKVAPDPSKIDKLNDKLEVLEGVVKDFSDKLRHNGSQNQVQYSLDVNNIYEKMIDQDVTNNLANAIAGDVEQVVSKMQIEPMKVAQQLIVEKLGEGVPVKLKKFKQNIVVFVGPTGAGKTTTLVKLAGHFVGEDDLKVGIINTDTFRVAAQEQLQIYSDIMNIPLNKAYTKQELNDALKQQEDRDLILIDTAGKSVADVQYITDMKNIMETCKIDQVFIVMSVTTAYKACKEIIDHLSFVGDYKIIITKLDEVTSWGNVLNFVDYAKKPISYLTIGQNIPDDIEQLDASKIAANILKQGESV